MNCKLKTSQKTNPGECKVGLEMVIQELCDQQSIVDHGEKVAVN